MKDSLPFTGDLLSFSTQAAVIEGIVSESSALFMAHIGDSETKPDFDESDRELLEFLHNKERPNGRSVWKFCKIAITIEETKEKPPVKEDGFP
jgi:hypothetical protein